MSAAHAPAGAHLPAYTLPALAVVIALVLAWRTLVAGIDAQSERDFATGGAGARVDLAETEADIRWRRRLERNPADATAVLVLGLALERQGKRDEAAAAMRDVLRLAPANPQSLREVAGYFLRTGDEAQALVTLRRSVESSSAEADSRSWQTFVAALDSGRYREFFEGIARDDPAWWPAFFRFACEKSANGRAVHDLFAMRVEAARVTVDERNCMVERLQRDGRWTYAYQLWLNGLPLERRQRVGYVYNGDFEYPLTNLGFDWRVPEQDGVAISTSAGDGASGPRALDLNFAGKLPGGPPVFQFMVLYPGHYRLEGRGKTDIDSRLALQWALYCHGERAPRQLVRSGGLAGRTEWREFSAEFVVPTDCPVQLLRLELADPNNDAKVPGSVAARVKGTARFGALRVRIVDGRG